jgi:hypothetical protein
MMINVFNDDADVPLTPISHISLSKWVKLII